LLAGIKDRTGRYVFVNRAMAAWFRVRGVEMAGRRDAEVLAPAIAAFVRESEEKLLRGEETLLETEVDQAEWLPGAGEGRWLLNKVLLRGAPCGDAILVVAQEITELHRAQIELARQRDFAQAVLDSSRALIIVLDAAGRLVRWNRECERATGYHESECRGQPFADLLGTPESRPDLLKAFSRILSGEAVAGEPAEILARGGRRLLLDISGGVVRDERGDPEWVVLTAIDRTVEKLAEARRKELALELEAIWNSSLDGLAFLDSEGRIAAANPAFCRLAGIQPDHAQNAFVTSVMAEWPGFESAELERFRDCFRRRAFDPFSTREVRLRDGRKVWLELASSFVPRTGAEPLLLISARDITSRIRSEQELRSANEFLQSTALWARELAAKAESASAAKTEFLAHVSHELRTPINAILGLLELTLQSSPPPAQRESLEMARESAESLIGLVDDLLDVAKAESGRLSVNPAPVGLRHVLNGVMRLMVHRGAAKGLHVRWRVAADVPDAILADGARLRQVIANLVGNAIKYTSRGAVELHVGRIGPPDSPRLCFVVQDTGCGIPPEHWQAIFEPFVRFHKDAAGGTGLGLTISASLVELMGGRLYVSSQPGSGALFGFSIPLQEAVPEAGSQPAVPAVPEKATAGHAARILVAEDNPLNQQVIRGLLEKNGFSVTVVSDGAAAVEQALSGRFDLVLMDVQMPGLDGWQAARAIRDREPQNRRIPILAMTARALEEDAAACRAAGMDGYLAKPIRMAEVLAAIAEHLPIRFSSFPAADPPAAQPDLTQERLESQVKYLDLEQALDRLGGDRALLSELAGLFCDEGPRLLQQAADALAAGDLTAVQNAAHQLKGLLAQFAAAEAREAAWQLELEARRADLIAAAPKLQALREKLSEVLPELRILSENP
jgi:PAS domain S-box-containing protein